MLALNQTNRLNSATQEQLKLGSPAFVLKNSF